MIINTSYEESSNFHKKIHQFYYNIHISPFYECKGELLILCWKMNNKKHLLMEDYYEDSTDILEVLNGF